MLSLLLMFSSHQPSNDRNWTPDQQVLPFAEVKGNLVNVHNIRNCRYRSTEDYDVSYYDKIFDVNQIRSVDYIVEPFSKWSGSAHAFLSFGFAGEQNKNYLSVSIEIRKKQGDSFSPFKGLFRYYELMYVVADERDVIKLRTNYRKDNVFIYPMHMQCDEMKKLFLIIIERINNLNKKPEFYNTLTNMCTITMVKHINDAISIRLPLFSYKWILPAYSDALMHKLGLLKPEKDFFGARQKYKINKLAAKYAESDDFSLKIRGG